MLARLENLIEEMLAKGVRLDEASAQFERVFIKLALDRASGSKTDAAKLLGVHRNTLASKLKNHQKAKRPTSRTAAAKTRRPRARKSARRK
jgi:DNA-binding NtrC family response regulator